MTDSLRNKQVTVLGLGLTGRSCVRFAKAHGAQVVAMDTRAHLSVELDVPMLLGPFDSDALCQADLILISPGVDPKDSAIQAAKAAGIEIIGDIELFARYNQVPVIAITGSNGKSTVTELTAQILEAHDAKVLVGGNFGTPVLELLDKPADYMVLELSSFQLESLSSLRCIAATVLNVSEDHIDRHGSLEAYAKAKARIYQLSDTKVFNLDDTLTWPQDADNANSFSLGDNPEGYGCNPDTGQITYRQQPVLTMSGTRLIGLHNLMNLQAAAALVKGLEVPFSTIQKAANQYQPLPHRCELVAHAKGIKWINDSKATNVGATMAAIQGLSANLQGKLILILGGDSKGADLSPLAKVSQQVSVMTLGKDAPLIEAYFPDATRVSSLPEAVNLAVEWAESGDIVLLSPACASIDMFDNYIARGESFTQAVKEMIA